MLTINKLIPGGRGLAAVLLKRAPSLTLDEAQCRTAAFSAVDSSGRALAIALPAGTVLHRGDVLVGADGSLVKVHNTFEPEPVAVIPVVAAHVHGPGCGHDHHHHGHDHGHDHGAPGHVHGPGCGHDH